MDKWYVAAMNDCIFIVDQQPRPAPVDHVNPNLPAPNVVISMRSGSREAQEIAELIVNEHNAAMARVCGLLDCPMCEARKKFVINPLDTTVGYCMAEQRAWRVTSLTCLNTGCLSPKATFGDYCMSCLEQRVNAEG
jgi:hypothetical protein